MNVLSSMIFFIWLIPVTVFILIPLSTMCVHLVRSLGMSLARADADNVGGYARGEAKAA